MTTYFTADHHFGHANIIKYTNRPFKSVEEMDNELIRRWNEKVKVNDIVYHLGDFTLLSYKDAYSYLDKLNGNIFIVPGGHDKRWVRHAINFDNANVLPSLATYYFGDDAWPFILCHYPLLSWDRSHYGSIHLHGHSHGTIPNEGGRFDVGIDTNDFYPYSLEDVMKAIEND